MLMIVLEVNIGPKIVFITLVLIMLVYNHMSAYEFTRDECRAKHCLQYSGPYNARVESYECVGDECRAKRCLQYISLFNASAES